MDYEKQNFKNEDILNASQLNHIEDGIVTLSTELTDHKHKTLTIGTQGEGYSMTTTYDGSNDSTINLTPSSIGLFRLSSDANILSYNGSDYNSGGSRVALGYNNNVTGAISAAIGQANEVTGACSLAIGRVNKSAQYSTMFIGSDNKEVNSSGYSYAFGEGNYFGFKEGDYFSGGSTSASQAYGSFAIGKYNHVGAYSVAMGENNYVKANGSAFGRNCAAYDYSIAVGDYAQALSNKAVAVGIGASANANGGYYPAAFGYYSRAEAGYTLAMGASSYARKQRAIGIGGGDAKEEESLAIGYCAYAFSKCSAALTPHAYATGENAVCIGYGAVTQAKNAIAIGYETRIGETGEGVTAMGHFNDTAVTGCSTGTTGTALVIGNGTSGDARSNACRITFAGAVIGKAAYQSSGADYAEYFEWLDGNVDDEDRRGYFVTLDGDKIKKAKEGDYILGIVSAYPAVIGNNDMEWSGKFLLDEFGDPIKKVQKTIIKEHELNKDVHFTDEEMRTLTDEERKQREMKEVEKEVECEYFVLNPDFDPDKEYIHRADRPEWDTIGMLGVLTVYDDGTCQVNGFCKCNNDGIATACERGFDTYRVIERVNENLIKVVFK